MFLRACRQVPAPCERHSGAEESLSLLLLAGFPHEHVLMDLFHVVVQHSHAVSPL